MKTRNLHIRIRKQRNGMLLARNIFAIILFLAVAISLCFSLIYMQDRASEFKQRDNSQKILQEIANTLQDNSNTVEVIDEEFDSMNQNLLDSLAYYLAHADVMEKVQEIETGSDPIIREGNTKALCNLFREMSESINVSYLYLIKEDGHVLISNENRFLGQNMKDAFQGTNLLFSFYKDRRGNIVRNGSSIIDANGQKIASHVQTGNYYTYSTLLGEDGQGSKYFLMTSILTNLLDDEVAGLKQIQSVLKGVTVGREGFLFAIDKKNGTFLYFDDGNQNLSGLRYAEHGLSRDIENDNYAGYETIDGVSYYCVSKEFESNSFGQYTVIAAAETKNALLDKNVTIVAFSSIIFIIVSSLIAGYALILRRDVANKTIELQNKFINDYKDDIKDGKFAYTEEEILERADICLTDAIVRQTDTHFKRINIGTRSRKGSQTYLSRYIFGKLIPVAIIGLALVFGISFFSQTLISLEDVTSLSATSINDIPLVMQHSSDTQIAIHSYIDKQYVSTVRLLTYIFEEQPETIFQIDRESLDCNRLFTRDGEGNKTFLKDHYGNLRYSQAHSEALQAICKDNNLEDIYVIDEDGYTIATSSEFWYFALSKTKGAQSYPFWDIIDGKCQSLAQEPMIDEVRGETRQYIGNAFFYYTYQGEDGSTCYANKGDYQDFLNGNWKGNAITKHRGLIQICINRNELANLFKITNLDYILAGMHVYGSNSFYMAFDKTEDHTVLYSPIATSIGKTSASVGLTANAFEGNFNGFQVINGIKYYQCIRPIGNYFIATAVPVESLYGMRNAIAFYTLLFSTIFILFIAIIYSISTDKMDESYVDKIRTKYHSYSSSNSSFYITTPSGRKRKTNSAASRYAKIIWRDKTPEQKLSALILGLMTIASVLIVGMLIYVLTNSSSDSIFSYIFRGNWNRGWNIFAITEALMIMLMILTITKLVQICVRSFCGTLGARVETTGNLLVSVLKYGGLIGGLFYCLHLFGFNTTSLITSAGILSIVIGLGAQSLISDIIAGIFIVFEGEFRVGDIVTIGDFRGSVLEIGLRTTKIEEINKNIKIFNNSAISGVINMTKQSSYASIIVGIEYGESLERVEKVLKDAFPKIRKNLPKISDGPFYMGVNELGESSVNLRIMAQCEERDRIQLVRDLNREIYLVFNRNNINIPFPQVTLSHLEIEEKEKPSAALTKEARAFVEEQWMETPASIDINADN